MFQQGESLADICAALGGLHLYTVVMSLRQNGLAESAIEQRLPPEGDPLLIEYQRVCKRKSTSRYKAIQINPVQRVIVAQATTAR